MTLTYYDNLEPVATGEADGFVEVERIYCFDWRSFNESHWQELLRVYNTLPGAVPDGDLPSWFGADEKSPPFLNASVEPPGLQVYGVLPEADWRLWDQQFRSAAASLPQRQFQ